ncbi:hypothetical protein D9611_007742 [Ephemerocybe angulata]|uniref:WIBG Mago-binding domain-containing protein n=1 Tax=Ephemerocybe angulata TaxID=980116 RepID=A0A8H5BYT9_9AGAR|nr:hypothetical protein D9611_007742 [Tulosesus angulatus]
MSRPPIDPKKTAAGIALDPQTLDRVVPESRRPDGTVRKQLKIRPGFTPQEDVQRFRGKKQTQMDVNALPKGHIIGWVPPSSASASTKPLSKAAKKNAKRKEKRAQEKEEVPDNWDDDDEEDKAAAPAEAVKADAKSPAEDEASTKDVTDKLEALEIK